MELLKLIIIFGVMMLCIACKRKLRDAMLAAIICTIAIYRITPLTALQIATESLVEKSTFLVICSFILVTFIQKIMEHKKLLTRAELSLQRLSGNRRIVCILAPVIIGFLPSMGAVNVCGEIVDDVLKNDLSTEDKTFVTSYYRHISECISPTYNGILLALSLTAVKTGEFVLLMFPLVMVLILLGYVMYLRKVDRSYPIQDNVVYTKSEELKQLVYCFWTLIVTIIVVIAFNLSVLQVLPVVILISIFVYKLNWEEIKSYAVQSFEMRIILNTIILMIFKNLLTYSGTIERLTNMMGEYHLPLVICFGLFMLLGTLVSGSNAMVVLLVPLAFQEIPNAGPSLLVYLMAISYAAMQLTPTHICLTVITEYFHVSFLKLVQKTLPVIAIFMVIVVGYYYLLLQFGFH